VDPRDPPPTAHQIGLIVSGAGMLICFIAMTRLDHFTRQGTVYLALFFAAFLFYLAAAALTWRRPAPLALIFAAALLFRAPLWFTEPSLSTDVWRYLWDGHLVTNGANPYAERVDSPALDPLNVPLREHVEHGWMATPYPPAAVAVFGGVDALIPGSPTAMQVTFSLFDLATGLLIARLLRRLGRPPGRALLYLWNPLIVVEFAHGAHVDALMAFLVVLALSLLLARRHTWSAVALALAVLVKLVPLILLPVFVRRWGVWRTLMFALILALGFVPFAGAGLGLGPGAATGLFGAARIYAAGWRTNDGLFYWLAQTLDPLTSDPVLAAKLAGLLALGGLGLWVMIHSVARSGPETHRGDGSADRTLIHAALLIAAYLLISPAVFPWYLAWLLALLPLLPLRADPAARAFAAGWIVFSATVNLSYLFYLDPAHPHEIMWVRPVEYLPLFAFLIAALALAAGRDHRSITAPSRPDP
jgi:alpha-1,6-mannosyltransferase